MVRPTCGRHSLREVLGWLAAARTELEWRRARGENHAPGDDFARVLDDLWAQFPPGKAFDERTARLPTPIRLRRVHGGEIVGGLGELLRVQEFAIRALARIAHSHHDDREHARLALATLGEARWMLLPAVTQYDLELTMLGFAFFPSIQLRWTVRARRELRRRLTRLPLGARITVGDKPEEFLIEPDGTSSWRVAVKYADGARASLVLMRH